MRAEAHPPLEPGVTLDRAVRHRRTPSQGAAGISGSLVDALGRLGRRTSAAWHNEADSRGLDPSIAIALSSYASRIKSRFRAMQNKGQMTLIPFSKISSQFSTYLEAFFP